MLVLPRLTFTSSSSLEHEGDSVAGCARASWPSSSKAALLPSPSARLSAASSSLLRVGCARSRPVCCSACQAAPRWLSSTATEHSPKLVSKLLLAVKFTLASGLSPQLASSSSSPSASATAPPKLSRCSCEPPAWKEASLPKLACEAAPVGAASSATMPSARMSSSLASSSSSSSCFCGRVASSSSSSITTVAAAATVEAAASPSISDDSGAATGSAAGSGSVSSGVVAVVLSSWTSSSSSWA
eukprot:scaffold1793_cov399-Prasinococcus_capsulatus_cf.AAC.8